MSRILAFALAAMLAVAFVLWFTLDNLFPLSKKQIFFMSEQERFITISPYYPNSKNLELFKENFIRQYINERLGVIPNASAMSRRWGAAGRIRAWSSPEVYRDFSTEKRTQAVLAAEPFWSTRVYFLGNPTPRGQDRYSVRVKIIDEKIDELGAGQTEAKISTIILRLTFENDRVVRWDDRLKNPFGVVVSEFRIEEAPASAGVEKE
ncbi:MAG: hypothetical protein LBG89_00885 [Rickettsiales bacterium]|jgi:type IV secretory pathway component VirB8|nr:hypothetical protein [Rickettsiales bacterium]